MGEPAGKAAWKFKYRTLQWWPRRTGGGANGGDGGSLTLHDPAIMQEQILKMTMLIWLGGKYGSGGIGGYSGSVGLGPNRKDERSGPAGAKGIDGLSGKDGTITYVVNLP